MHSLQLSDNFWWNSDQKLTFYQYSCVEKVKSIVVYMKYLHNIIIKGNLTTTRETFISLQCANSYISHGVIWNFVDIRILGFPCTVPIAQNFNSLNTT